MTDAREMVAILDFGSQYAQLIARRVRECGVYGEIVSHDITVEEVRKLSPKGLVLSGGPASVLADGSPRTSDGIFEAGVPVLGICYGMQLMAEVLGGRVARAAGGGRGGREYGPAGIEVLKGDGAGAPGLFSGLPRELDVWMSHGDRVAKVPEGFAATARTDTVDVVAMADPPRRLYGVQFHPEVVHTPRGKDILGNFLFGVCGCAGDWTMENFVESSVADIRATVGDGRILCGISGGVDSAVAAVLCHRAVGDRLDCVFVDNGLLRSGEVDEVSDALEALGVRLHVVDATDEFLDALAGVDDPEQKRIRIGNTLKSTCAEESSSRTTRSASRSTASRSPRGGPSATIKSHHNVGGLPERMNFDLVEPLRYLFKDEVRKVGRLIGLPTWIVERQPFPGPGLAVRMVSDVTRERLAVLREADRVVREELSSAQVDFEIWQGFAVLLPVRSVGVMGDERTYENAVVLRIVTSEDGMTADWARLPHDLLAKISSRIVNEVKGVNRVAYDITSKPPGTIEWE